MNPDESAEQPQGEETSPMAEAPSRRAKALREEIFGSALTLDEAAYILSLDRTTVAKYLREKTIAGFQIGREWLIPEEELRAYVRRMTESAMHPDASGTPRDLVIGLTLLERMRHLTGRKRGKEDEPVKTKPVKMSDRFDKFTERARKVLTYAQEEARSFNHNYIGTEHLLLGLVREGEGVAAKVLTSLGVELYRVRSAVEFIIGRGNQEPVRGEVGLTPRAKKVMELAVDEARRLDHHYVGTEHILLGLVREGEGIAAGVLESLGVSLDTVRMQTIRVLVGISRAADEVTSQPVTPAPPEAAALVGTEEQAVICPRCDARCPRYFHYCFNCGAALQQPA